MTSTSANVEIKSTAFNSRHTVNIIKSIKPKLRSSDLLAKQIQNKVYEYIFAPRERM